MLSLDWALEPSTQPQRGASPPLVGGPACDDEAAAGCAAESAADPSSASGELTCVPQCKAFDGASCALLRLHAAAPGDASLNLRVSSGCPDAAPVTAQLALSVFAPLAPATARLCASGSEVELPMPWP
jgi:hypothetical protein